MKFAIIGMGFIYPRHKNSIEAIGGEVLLTCDIDQTKNPDYTDYRKLIKDPKFKEVTHVAVLTPNFLHCQMIHEFAEKGKVVLCEKPFVLNSWQIDDIPDNVFCVLQMRYHPDIQRLKRKKLKGIGTFKARAMRGQWYWDGWKGDEEKSGGILFNFGIHYLDLLIYIFGDYEVLGAYHSDKQANGSIKFKDVIIHYEFEIADDEVGQDRCLKIGKEEVSLSRKDNLSYEGFHQRVYEDLIKGKGITPQEAKKSIELVEKLKEFRGVS